MTNEVAIKEKFELAVTAAHKVDLIDNANAAFGAAVAIKGLREVLTDEVIKDVFMPLMNTRVGFMTDKNKQGESYSIEDVRTCLIDGICIGLLPTGNQINIISGRMYPTKEGYTSLLKKIGVKYIITIGQDLNQSQTVAELKVRIDYEFKGEKNVFPYTAQLKKTAYTGIDQLKGKAERRAKKALFEYLTGCDLGEGDASEKTEDVKGEVISSKLAEPTPAEKTGAKTEQQKLM